LYPAGDENTVPYLELGYRSSYLFIDVATSYWIKTNLSGEIRAEVDIDIPAAGRNR
jgi:hypothetical protein